MQIRGQEGTSRQSTNATPIIHLHVFELLGARLVSPNVRQKRLRGHYSPRPQVGNFVEPHEGGIFGAQAVLSGRGKLPVRPGTEAVHLMRVKNVGRGRRLRKGGKKGSLIETKRIHIVLSTHAYSARASSSINTILLLRLLLFNHMCTHRLR